MATAAPPTTSSEPISAAPRIAAVLIPVVILLLIGVAGEALSRQLTGVIGAVVYFTARAVLVGAALRGGAALGRLVSGEPAGAQSAGRLRLGSLSTLGLLVGVFLLPLFAAPALPAGAGAEGPLVIGQPIEIVGPTLDGRRYDLAEYRGKVVLVDFWATWCRPCVAELPNVRAAYDQYHDRGLEIVSVSLDERRGDLEKFLKANPLPWPQIYFDSTDPAALAEHPANRYGIHSIPCLLVIDGDGKLIAQNVRGREIRAAVARALGEPVPDDGMVDNLGSRLLRAPIYSVLAAP
jgi:thiol-disulfide isomerase/thioredoxin